MSGRDPDRRRTLLDAADRVIRREGPEASMAAIAAEAGITKPILYRHFGDKSGLYQALANRHVRTVVDLLRQQFEQTGTDLRGRARSTITAYLDMIAANLSLYRFLFHRAGAEDSRTHSQMTAIVRSLGEELGEVIAAASEGLGPVRAQVLGHAFVGMVQATGDWWLEHPEVDRTEVVESLVGVIVAAMSSATASLR
ncbi:TetR family transcriptional regulator [Planobispora longispora]|uniref:TetR family transcriptional regulator n=1 Tax=Planobispora longispora TaxID=28887 RepID=A0A8J3W8Z9_9ACTN|nr:TetR family transcriptional regulator [Planobispora longispora]BFE78901.1 TetR family transcriptional regulator [Planobispora longispora]GIH80312.1 TetR family transcriptional regulator [Planobispora longispora]